MIKTLKELRDMDVSLGCPKIKELPDTIDPTKYYPFIQKVLSQEYIKVEDIVSLIELAYDKYVVPYKLIFIVKENHKIKHFDEEKIYYNINYINKQETATEKHLRRIVKLL